MNGNESAFASTALVTTHGTIVGGSDTAGLTKRELFAALAMQGLLANGDYTFDGAAMSAIKYADCLIKQLSEPPK